MMKFAKGIALAIFMIAAMVFSVAPASADTYVEAAATAFQTSHFYVSPEVNLPNDKRARIAGAMRDGDNIYVAMLPALAAQSSDDAQKLADELERKLPQPAILVIDAGGFVKAVSSGALPADVIASRLDSATSIATNSTEAIWAFIRDIHRYQDDHPAPKPPVAEKPNNDGPRLLGFGIGLLVTLSLIYGFKAYRRSPARRLKNVPDSLRPQLLRIQKTATEVKAKEIRGALMEIHENSRRMFTAIRENDDASIKEIQVENVLKKIAGLAEQYAEAETRGTVTATATQKVLRSLHNQNDQLLNAIQQANRGENIKLEVAADMLDSTGI